VLLERHQIPARALESLHEHNERHRAGGLAERLAAGANIALCSDAGTPLISDPGGALVVAAIEAGAKVVPIPGPNAAVAALIASGLPLEPFRFGGFLPRRGDRRRLLEALAEESATHVFYESPKRLREALADIREVWGERRVAVAREMTKVHEELLRGSPSDILAALPEEVLGEITLVVEGAPARPARQAPEEDLLDLALKTALRAGASVKDAAHAAAEEVGIAKKIAYARALELLQRNKPEQ
jgi:16S rRNA (cytidine1402-2'-O)-methyltransferase